jgi:uncharacterized protein YozE (UPF0346 family)
MKLINGTEMIDNSPNEKAGELAEAIYDDVLFILDIEHKCIQEDEDGNTSDTEYGQDLFNGIYEQCMVYFERENNMTFDELYELYVTATNEVATLKDENKALLKQLEEKMNERYR